MSSVATLPPRTKQEQIKPPVDKSRIASSEADIKPPKEAPEESSEKVSVLPSTSSGREGPSTERREIVTA